MKRCCIVIVALFLMCGCHTSSDIVKEKNDIRDDNTYEFSGNELVALFSRFYLTGTGEEGVLLIFADGGVVAGMGEYGKILGDRMFLRQELEGYLIEKAELVKLDDAQMKELLSLIQEIKVPSDIEYISKQPEPQVEITKLYEQFCIQWTDKGATEILVNQGNDRSGTISRNRDENAQRAVENIFAGEYIDEWYSLLNDWFANGYHEDID